jgi:hypothetical protein
MRSVLRGCVIAAFGAAIVLAIPKHAFAQG